MRVALISKACIVGIYQRKLEFIAQQGVDLLTIVPPSWKDERGETRLERVFTDGYDMEVLPLNFNGNFHLYHFRNLGRVLRKFQPDIVHIDEEPYNLAAWQMMFHARMLSAKTVFFSWQNILRRYPPPFNSGESWFLKHSDYAMVGNAESRQVWRNKGYDGDIAIIPQFGTDVELFSPSNVRPERPFTVGFIGRLVAEKGLFTLVEALRGIGENWQLRIVGDGPLRDELKRKIAEIGLLDQTVFVGQIPSTHMPQQYHEMDVLVLPSLTMPNWKEQFGRVLIEAMASGVPVIGSDSGAIPEVIGDSGIVFAEGNSQALRNALIRMSESRDLRGQLSHKGRNRVMENYTHQKIANQTLQVYEYLIN